MESKIKENLLKERSQLVESIKAIENSNNTIYIVHKGSSSFENLYGIKLNEILPFIEEKIKTIDKKLGI